MAASKKATKKVAKKKAVKKATAKKNAEKKEKKPKDIYAKKIKIASLFEVEPVLDLTKDTLTETIKAARKLSVIEARFLRDTYCSLQRVRIATENRLRSCLQGLDDQPLKTLEWMYIQQRNMEAAIAKCLKAYSEEDEICQWSASIPGIAHTISLHLRGMIDIREAPTPGHLQSFAGLIPPSKIKWKEGDIRPYSAELKKTLLGILGDSFVKLKNKDNDIYGKIYTKHKEDITERNERGEYAGYIKEEMARLEASGRKLMANAAKTYPDGKLPKGQIHRRAIRKAVKMFLDHYWEVSYCLTYGKRPKISPYAIAHQGHVHKVDPPNFDIYAYPEDDVDRMAEYRKYQIEKEQTRQAAITGIVKELGSGSKAVDEVLKKRLARSTALAEKDIKFIAESLAA